MSTTPLYLHEREDFYECMGCHELLEVPFLAVLKNGQQRVAIKRNPENRLLWIELMSIEHGQCGKFKDEQKAQDQRTFRKHPLFQRAPLHARL